MRYSELFEASRDELPPAAVIFSGQAVAELDAIYAWLSQRGAGRRAAALAKRLSTAIDKLERTAGMHPQDRFNPANRQLVVGGYVVSYRYVVSENGNRFVYVERVFSPGQDRTLPGGT